jgi:hypothetical protein
MTALSSDHTLIVHLSGNTSGASVRALPGKYLIPVEK